MSSPSENTSETELFKSYFYCFYSNRLWNIGFSPIYLAILMICIFYGYVKQMFFREEIQLTFFFNERISHILQRKIEKSISYQINLSKSLQICLFKSQNETNKYLNFN